MYCYKASYNTSLEFILITFFDKKASNKSTKQNRPSTTCKWWTKRPTFPLRLVVWYTVVT